MPGEDVPIVAQDPDLQGTAEAMAASLLRAKNIHEYKSIITISGMLCFPNGVPIQSGEVILIKNKGLFDGKWIIHMVRFALLEGRMVVELDLRKCIAPRAELVSMGQENLDPSKKKEDPEKKTEETTKKAQDTVTQAQTSSEQTPADWAHSQLSPEEQQILQKGAETGDISSPEYSAASQHYQDLISQFMREHQH